MNHHHHCKIVQNDESPFVGESEARDESSDGDDFLGDKWSGGILEESSSEFIGINMLDKMHKHPSLHEFAIPPKLRQRH